MPQTESNWRYYVPADGESSDDAHCIMLWSHQRILDTEDAASFAAEQEWSDGGWERGIEAEFSIVVIHPESGDETTWTVSHEVDVNHYVRLAP